VRRLRIAIVSQYYPPEIGAPQARVLETARAFARRGHRVTVLTGFPNHPTGVVPPRWRGRLTGSETEPGVRVVRGWLAATRNRGAMRRTWAHVTCALSSFVRGLAGAGGADVFVATSPPLFTGLVGLLLARLHRRPFVLDVRDLWPDAFVDLGLASEGPVVGAFRRLERFLYARADHVVPVTDAFSTRIGETGVESARRTVIRNGVELARFDPRADPLAAKRALGLEGRFVVLYLGAHGVAQGLDALVPAAQASGRDVTFLFVGEGAEKERVVAAARASRGDVRFLDGVPRERVASLYAAADVCLVSLRPTPLMEAFLPSKAFEAFGAGRPVIAAVAGEAKTLLEAGPGAVVVPPGDPKALAAAIVRLATDPAATRAMGQAARARAEREFDRDLLAARYLSVLSSVVERARRRRRGA
jgi:glycosyltransferase involved in cell wall biosynthesis